MSVKVATLYAELSADNTKLNTTLQSSKGALTSFGGGLKDGLLGLVGITSAAAIGGMAIKLFADTVKASIAAAAAAELAEVKLAQALLSSGRGAEISSPQIGEFATSLMRLTGFDDEGIKDAYAAIAGFQNLPTDKMDEIVTISADMAAMFGGDLATNATMIAGVLETGLIPKTWRFDAALKEQIQSMIRAGDTGGALALMMDELNRKYGGQAAAQLDTYTGKVNMVQTAWSELLEAEGASMTQSAVHSGVLDATSTALMTVADRIGLVTRAEQLGMDIKETAMAGGLRLNNQLITQADLLALVESAEAGLAVTTSRVAETTQEFSDTTGSLTTNLEAAGNAATMTDAQYNTLFQTIGTLQGITDDYNETQGELITKQSEIVAAIALAISQGYDPAGSKIRGLETDLDNINTALDENATAFEENSRRAIFAIMATAAASDGWQEGEFEALMKVGEAWGIYSPQVVTQAGNMQAALERLATGTATLGEIQAYAEWMIAHPNVSMTFDNYINTIYTTTGTPPSGGVVPPIVFPMQHGGDVFAGQAYIVGEKRPEIFIPNQSGEILPSVPSDHEGYFPDRNLGKTKTPEKDYWEGYFPDRNLEKLKTFETYTDYFPDRNLGKTKVPEKGYEGYSPFPMQHGGDVWVHRPTLFLAGETEPERVTVTPQRAGGEIPPMSEMPGRGGEDSSIQSRINPPAPPRGGGRELFGAYSAIDVSISQQNIRDLADALYGKLAAVL